MSCNGDFLFEHIKRLSAYNELKSGIEEHKHVNIYGLEDTCALSVIAALKTESTQQMLYLCENDMLARRRAEDFRSLGIKAQALASQEISFFKATASSNEISQQRLKTLGDFLCKKTDVLVVSAEASLTRLMQPQRFLERITKVRTGMTAKPDRLISSLTQSGYARVDIVESRGQCALRGGIIDVYPVGMPNAIRIEFFDDEIDQMREFDVLTQRSLEQIAEVEIYPAKELLLSSEESIQAGRFLEELLSGMTQENKLDRQRILEKQFDLTPYEQFFESEQTEADSAPDTEENGEGLNGNHRQEKKPFRTNSLERRYMPVADALQSGRSVDIDPSFTCILDTSNCSIFEFASEALIAVEQADRYKERCTGVRDDFILTFKAAFERGEALKHQAAAILSYDEILPALKAHTIISIDSFLRSKHDIAPQRLIKFDSSAAIGFSGNICELAGEIKRLTASRMYTVLLSGGIARGQRLSKELLDYDIVAPFSEDIPHSIDAGIPYIIPLGISSGMVLPGISLYVFGEDDIFGRGKHKRRLSSSSDKRITAFTQLKPGDYVVHENHGIGQYMGTVRMTVDGAARDFLNIRYGGTDKLYVPTDQMDRIQKYIGAEGEAPKLNHLSGGDWQKQKAKAKRAIKEIAGELIKLYAERSTVQGYAFSPDTPWQKDFEDSFPFEETPDQLTAISEIKADMEKPLVMDRLLCGDVGYGKTEVALRAIFKCVSDGKQAVLLAPTTILVQQHYATALNRFANFPVNIETLSRFKTPAEQKEVIRKLKTGEIDFVIGTHRLLGKDIEFRDLGLLVVDEEQRFGVGHKEKIKQYKKSVDVLTLSATPIPRTLHMSMVGIRDMSILKTPPEERFPVQTYVVEYSDGLIRDAILREVSRGGQVYVLHNRVQTIDLMYSRLKKLVPEVSIAIGHGQMREQQLEDVMLDFYDGKFDVLLCSTIIEAGLDVPRANTLIVLDSDRFGLAQLYQLRGRVGRSNRIAYAYLTVNPNKILTDEAEKRLNAIRDFTEFGSGFRVAMRDLEIRGTGNILGAEQSGHMEAIGYDLYVKLINETVAEMQGTQTASPIQTRMELNIDAYLSSDYIAADTMRIEMYKRIAEIRDNESRDDVIDELIDRFGDPGKPVMNLINIAKLKSQCEKLGIDSVSFKDGSLNMRFSEEANLDLRKLLVAVSNEKLLKFIPRKPGILTYGNAAASPDKLLEPCADALHNVINNIFGD